MEDMFDWNISFPNPFFVWLIKNDSNIAKKMSTLMCPSVSIQTFEPLLTMSHFFNTSSPVLVICSRENMTCDEQQSTSSNILALLVIPTNT